MSLCQLKVCYQILKEHFGSPCEQVGRVLCVRGSCHLRHIASESGLEINKVRTALAVLIQHNVVTYESNKRGQTEYSLNVPAVLWRQYIPSYIHCAKSLYGDGAELVIEDILHHGQKMMSQVVNNVAARLNEALEHSGHPKISSSVVYDKFKNLASTHFIQQCPNTSETVSTKDERETEALFNVPPLSSLQERKRKRSTDGSGIPAKRAKNEEAEEKAADDGIYWRVNEFRFHQYFRDQCLVKALSRKIDEKAGSILQTMLRLSEVNTEDLAFTSSPLAFNEIQQAVSKDLGLTRHQCEQYLSIMADDSTRFVTKVGDSGGGMFTVNIMKALQSMCEAHVENVIQERFGSKSLRIFRVLLLKKHLEQKQIEEMAMIPGKEAKELLYNMFAQNFISITELSKTPDHAPARTYYLFRVHIHKLARMLLERSYKALFNAMIKREVETKENRRLMEKQERVEAILASLEQTGADETQKEEILQTITPAEKSQLNRVKHMISMLEQSELQLGDTIFILQTFLHYSDQKLKLKL